MVVQKVNVVVMAEAEQVTIGEAEVSARNRLNARRAAKHDGGLVVRGKY